MRTARALLAVPVAAATLLLASCAADSHTFRSRAAIADTADLDAHAEVRQAIDGIIARGNELGMRIEERPGSRVVLVGASSPAGGTVAPPDDLRRVMAEGEFDTSSDGALTYEYAITLVGDTPADSPEGYEQAVLRTLLIVREAFETPFDLSNQRQPAARTR